MDNNITERIVPQRPYRHFKGRLYFVHLISHDADSGEKLVSYQALYPPYDMYMRPLDNFASSVDINRPDNITKQSYRFELYDGKMEVFNS